MREDFLEADMCICTSTYLLTHLCYRLYFVNQRTGPLLLRDNNKLDGKYTSLDEEGPVRFPFSVQGRPVTMQLVQPGSLIGVPNNSKYQSQK